MPHGDAVFVDLARLQVQACAALVFDARCAAWHLPWQKAQAHIYRAGRQVERGGLLLEHTPGKLIVEVDADFAVGGHFQAFPGNDQYAVVRIALGTGRWHRSQRAQ
ncbi:hypothetical protein D3C80_1938200 [compost metagenome]